MEIDVKELTTCSVSKRGETVSLKGLDQSGQEVSIRFPFRHAQAISMTLPHLLSRALVAQTGDKKARFVFRLGDWKLEDSKDNQNVIMTLQTADGFKVSFALTVEACAALGPAIERAAAQGGAGLSGEEDNRRELPALELTLPDPRRLLQCGDFPPCWLCAYPPCPHAPRWIAGARRTCDYAAATPSPT